MHYLYLPNQISLKLIFCMLFLIHVYNQVFYSWQFFCWYTVEVVFLNFVLICNQIKVWDVFQTDFSSFIIKTEFCRGFFTILNGIKSFAFILQCFTRHLITFVNITVLTLVQTEEPQIQNKKFSPQPPMKNQETFGMVYKYQYDDSLV